MNRSPVDERARFSSPFSLAFALAATSGLVVWASACGFEQTGNKPPGANSSSSSTTSSSSSSGEAGGGGSGGAGGSAGAGGMGGASSSSSTSSTSSSTSSSGMGGAGGAGGMGGAGGAGGGSTGVIREWTAGVPGVGTPPVYTFPDGWLEISCPTADRTSQVSASTLYRGYGANAARPRNVVGKWGLSVESTRKNKILNSDSWSAIGMGWNQPGGVMNAVQGKSDPAGGTVATQFDSSGGQTSYTVNGLTKGYASAWLKGAVGVSPYSYFAIGPAGTGWSYVTVNTTTWKRYDVANAEGYFRLETTADSDGDPLAIMGNTSTVAFGAQYESLVPDAFAHYPSSYIPNTAMARTREADKLFSNFYGEIFAAGGYLNMVLKFAPNYATGEEAGDHDIFFIDAANRIYFDSSKAQFVLKTNNTPLAAPVAGMVSWKREQELTITVKTSAAGREFSLSGADGGNFSKVADPGATDAPVPTNKPIYILSKDTGATECADLRYIGFFKP